MALEARKGEAGFTIIEVLVAALIIVIASMTTFSLLSAATKNTARAKATQVALDRAQQEIEKLRSLTNKELAMTSVPSHLTSEYSPAFRVNSTASTYALVRQPVGGYQKMVYNGSSLYGGGSVSGGVVNPGPVPFTSGDVKGQVYRFIVWRNDEKCSETKCPGPQDYKQIVVAVKLNSTPSQAAERGYVEVQSNFIDPEDSSKNDPASGVEGVVSAQQFFLTDTPCSGSGATVRQEITGEHLLHNTLGTCASGLQKEGTPGAPDALLLGSPPDPSPGDDSSPPQYDYSNDFYLEPTPDTDKGLQIRRDDTSGCHNPPTGTTTPQSQIHRWVTDPMASNFKLSGQVTLKLWTSTVNGIQYSAGICAYLFKRHEQATAPKVTDTMFANKVGGKPYWEYSLGGTAQWPSTPKEISLVMPLSVAPYTIPAGDRLGFAITVDPAKMSNGADAIALLYDNPYQGNSHLEVETTTPIEGG